MEIIKNKKILLLSFVCLVLILTVPFGFSKIKSVTKEEKIKSLQLNELKSNLDSLDKLLSDSQAYSDKVTVILASLPASYKDVVDYTEQLEDLTSKNNQVLTTTIDVNTLDEKNSLASLKYSIKTEGNYLNYSQLLTDLANLPYHTKVDSIALDSSAGSVDTITTYRLYLLNYKETASTEIPTLNTGLIDNIYKGLEENRLKGGE